MRRAHDCGTELWSTRYRPTRALGFGNEIRRLAKKGLKSRDIERALGVNPETVRDALRGHES